MMKRLKEGLLETDARTWITFSQGVTLCVLALTMCVFADLMGFKREPYWFYDTVGYLFLVIFVPLLMIPVVELIRWREKNLEKKQG